MPSPRDLLTEKWDRTFAKLVEVESSEYGRKFFPDYIERRRSEYEGILASLDRLIANYDRKTGGKDA